MVTTAIKAADRSASLGFSDIVKIRNRVLEMKARGERVLQLEGGEPFMPTADYIKQAMKDALDQNQTRYAPSSGVPQLLEAIRAKLSRHNGIDVSTSDIIVNAGGLHALFCAFQSCVNPGDEVIFLAPYWTPIRDQVSFAGGVGVRIPWDEVRGKNDLTSHLNARLTAKTRVLYVNTPGNPTGDVLNHSQLESIARFAKANNLVVISDEAYEDLVYEGEHVSIGSFPDMFPRTITTFTLSKTFAMTGWRIAYTVADKTFMNFIRNLVLNTVNGVSTPTQWAATTAIRQQGDFAPLREEYRKRRDLLVRGLNEAGFRCLTPPGAFYLFPDCRERLGGDSWKAMETLLERTSIASVPGVVFGPEGEGHLRMSFSTSLEVIEQAVSALQKL